jgi:hypothetical protein
MTSPDVQQPDVSIRELEERWCLSRNGLKARARALGVDLIRKTSTLTVWPGDFVELGDRLHEHISSGKPLATFPGLAPDRISTSTSQSIAKQDDALIAAMAAAMAQVASAPPEDPLRRAKGLAEAADNGLVLTTDDLVALGVKGVDGFSDGDLAYGYVFSRHRQRNRTLWTIERAIVKSKSGFYLPASSSSNDSPRVGFAAFDNTGMSLFAATTIKG